MVFEYGHTMPHAIEKTYGDGTVPNGLGVTYGMLACSFVAEELGIMSEQAHEEHDSCVTCSCNGSHCLSRCQASMQLCREK